MARGDAPTTFSTYVAAAIAVEQNQAAATPSATNFLHVPPSPPNNPPFHFPALLSHPSLPNISPWIWMALEVLGVHSPSRNAVADLMLVSAVIVANQVT